MVDASELPEDDDSLRRSYLPDGLREAEWSLVALSSALDPELAESSSTASPLVSPTVPDPTSPADAEGLFANIDVFICVAPSIYGRASTKVSSAR